MPGTRNPIYDEVFSIAEGLPADEVRRRAAQAAESLAEIRAVRRGLPDSEKRVDAYIRSIYWAHLAEYLDRTGAQVFRADEKYAEKRTFRRRAHEWGEIVRGIPEIFRIVLRG